MPISAKVHCLEPTNILERHLVPHPGTAPVSSKYSVWS